MPRKRVPKTRASGQWTEARYWSTIRSSLRKLWLRWPCRKEALDRCRRPNRSASRRHKWEYQCSECLGWFYGDQVEVHHVLPCGSIRQYDDIGQFVERLLCEVSGLRVVCHQCHVEIHQG